MSEQNRAESTIKELDIELQKELLGLIEVNRSREYHTRLSVDAIRNFALSVGDDNPLYTDQDYARQTRWGDVIAPSIMTAIVNQPLLGERIPKELKKKTRGLFKGCQTFMSGGTWQWYRPMYAGDTIYSFEGEESVEEKASEFGGRTVHIVRRYVKLNQRAEVVGVYRALRIIAERKKARETGKYTNTEIAHYDASDIAEIDARYLAEQPRGSKTRYWEDVEIGDSVDGLQKGPLTVTDVILTHCAGYGLAPYRMLASARIAAKDRQRMPTMYTPNAQGFPDTAARVHWEPEAAKLVGNPQAYDWGLLREFWLYHVLSDWAGDDGIVISMRDEIRKFNYLGDLQQLSGKVTGKRQGDGQNLVDLQIAAVNQRGEETALAEATLALPSTSGAPATYPTAPLDLQQQAIEFMHKHNQLRHRRD